MTKVEEEDVKERGRKKEERRKEGKKERSKKKRRKEVNSRRHKYKPAPEAPIIANISPGFTCPLTP